MKLIAFLVTLAAIGLQLPSASHGFEKQNGRIQSYWANGQPRSDITYRDHIYEGEYRTYYESGRPYELRSKSRISQTTHG